MIRAHLAAPPSLAEHVTIANHGTIVTIRPETPVAEAWLRQNTGPEAMWWGGALVAEPRYVADLLQGLVDFLEAKEPVEEASDA